MASIQKRTNKNGTSHWRAVVRIKGYPTVCNHFDRKQEAIDWAANIERQIKLGKHNFERKRHSFKELIDRYINDGSLQNIKSSSDVLRHLNFWSSKFDSYDLVYLTPELIGKERHNFAKTLNSKKR